MGCNRDVQRRLEQAMTVEQLIEELQGLPPKAAVFFTVNYGDHGRTTQAIPVEVCEETEAKYLYGTAYSESGVALRDDRGSEEDDDEDDNEWTNGVVVLK